MFNQINIGTVSRAALGTTERRGRARMSLSGGYDLEYTLELLFTCSVGLKSLQK